MRGWLKNIFVGQAVITTVLGGLMVRWRISLEVAYRLVMYHTFERQSRKTKIVHGFFVEKTRWDSIAFARS